MKVLDLFSGIGGFSLGLERAGFTTAAFCEIDPYARRVLAKHWPGVPCYDDVRTLTRDRLAADGLADMDVVCGGFPCQDISVAGGGAGLAGERSGLWRDYARLVGELRPRFVIVENVAALLGRGLGDILGDLSALGYGAEWHCIPASAVGAPHQRDRVWVVAYAPRGGWREHRHECTAPAGTPARQPSLGGAHVADADLAGLSVARRPDWRQPLVTHRHIRRAAAERRWRRPAPGMGREAHGLPAWVDGGRPVEAWEGNTPRVIGRGAVDRRQRLMKLGNAVVPLIPEVIGRAIMEAAA